MWPVGQVVFGFTVYSQENTRLFQCLNTHDGGKPYPRLEPGQYRVTAQLEKMLLSPGRYFVDIGGRCDSKSLDWVANPMPFVVEESQVPEFVWSKGQAGLFHHPSNWEMSEVLE